MTLTLAAARRALRRHANPKKVAVYRGYFRGCGDDIFLGVTTPRMRAVAKAYWQLAFSGVRALMHSRVHEERSLAHAILGIKFRKSDERGKKHVFDFFMKNRRAIRAWDGVDDSAPYIVGPYLMERGTAPLYRLVKSRNIWDRRIALMATWPMIRKGMIADTLKLAAKVLGDTEDLIHKATGWMLREVGKRDMAALKKIPPPPPRRHAAHGSALCHRALPQDRTAEISERSVLRQTGVQLHAAGRTFLRILSPALASATLRSYDSCKFSQN